MQIRVRLVGAFRVGRFTEQTQDYPCGSSVKDVVARLQLPEQILGIALINDTHATFTDLLHDGDKLTLLPILEGG
ncbi:MoaD/ThiS family protein [Malonomonas rubra]|uniref:MoaD/ThiS family protein n=1 Tax=Malonomonas rubra TaxID=57040 RepID=UPI0026EE2239|nr:MoaD/ThiS family protein [Malonomonas rubra]